jgi:hypothetical protein
MKPYDPLYLDKADASTNVIWTENYSHGIYHIPFDEWEFGPTQSVVIEYNGEYTVVNEKGPGHAMMLVPFHLLGFEFIFGLLMVGLAVFATYMLGKRLFSCRVGFIAAALVLTNATVIVMWHRYYWTDASTMHLFILSFWLMVEAVYRYNGRSMNPREVKPVEIKERLIALGLGALSGLTFGASVSTRYPTGILVIALAAFPIVFFVMKVWLELKDRKMSAAIKDSVGARLLLIAFILGLVIVLYPLMQYNTEYFGGPLNSGYDATPLSSFDPIEGIAPRNSIESWSGNLGEGVINAGSNFIKLLPILIMRIPILLFVPLGIWFLRKRPIVIVLILIIAISFFTYMSLAWVDMYARLDMFSILWEPRYFMPSLPIITLLGAAGIDGLVNWRKVKASQPVGNPKPVEPETRVKGNPNPMKQETPLVGNPPPVKQETRMVAGAFIIVCLLLLCGLAPVSYYFMTDGVEGRPPGPGQQPMQPVVVTTDQLLPDSFRYDGRLVRVENASILGITHGSPFIRSQGSRNDRAIPVQFRDWPPGTIPNFQLGQNVEVGGMFMTFITPEGPRPVINVKYETQDFFRILP